MKTMLVILTALLLTNCTYRVHFGKACTPGNSEWSYVWLKEKGEVGISLAEVMDDVKDRDERDMNRKESPLVQAKDAILLDTSSMTEVEVIESISDLVKARASKLGID